MSAAAERLENLLDDGNPFVSSIELSPVVPVARIAPGDDRMRGLAQAVYDAGASGHRVGTPVVPFESPRGWRDVLRREVTDGFLQPATRWPDTHPRNPVEIRHAAELADGIADLVEAHLGPVRSSADVDAPRTGMGAVRSRHLLLVTDDWAAVLSLGLDD
ncbi:hypothetical protein ACFV1L_08545 [Kitasatospora sp. NPDC059646]|uniref:hypothetical protein n=1 Tax=Kitasatospora sp. NPDC059646 TaxID=3346893 RepID=UPI0036A36BFE